jgi:hypothetical protein
MQLAVVKRAAVAAVVAVAVMLVAVSLRSGEARGEQSLAAATGYTFDTGTVKLLHGANESYWTTAQAQGTFCGGRPLGDSWHVWGKYVQFIEGEPHVNPLPADGTATFDARGTQVSRSVGFPWFVQELSLRLTESPPKASIWFWNGQAVSRQEVVVELRPDPRCTVSVAVKSLDCTPEPALAGRRLTARAAVAVAYAGKPATLAPTAAVAWRAAIGPVSLKPLSTSRAGNVLRATWQLPKVVKARAAKVTLTVRTDGVTATKTHLHRVK